MAFHPSPTGFPPLTSSLPKRRSVALHRVFHAFSPIHLLHSNKFGVSFRLAFGAVHTLSFRRGERGLGAFRRGANLWKTHQFETIESPLDELPGLKKKSSS